MSPKSLSIILILSIIVLVISGNTDDDTNILKSEDIEIPPDFKKETEDCEIYTTLEQLRDKFGSNEYSLIQGLNARESRRLYHKLLPKCIINSPKYQSLSICEKAHKAFLARQANKKYTRERSNILVSCFAKIMDFWRHRRIDGATHTYLWNRKAKKINAKQCIIDENENNKRHVLWNDSKCQNVCAQMLKSSTRTNKVVDELFGGIKSENNQAKKSNTDTTETHNEL
eukprot:UN09855